MTGVGAGTQKIPRQLDWRGIVCALDRIRTYGLLLRRQTLYPLSYEGIGVPSVAGGTS